VPIHRVQRGECLSSIAARAGFAWQYLWDLPENARLRERGDPNVLLVGDEVFVPERRSGEQPAPAGQRHRFGRKGVPVWLRLVLREGAQVRANQPCTLAIGPNELESTSDGDGYVEFRIPPAERRAVLYVGEARDAYPLELGALDPIGVTSGVQARLNNLGFPSGKVDGIIGPRTRAALRAFQVHCELEPTGEPDSATRAELASRHGC